jgi:hypothetical protein
MKTICVNCGAILTDEHGRRLMSAEFDSRLPAIKPTNGVMYARCGPCHMTAVRTDSAEHYRSGLVQIRDTLAKDGRFATTVASIDQHLAEGDNQRERGKEQS